MRKVNTIQITVLALLLTLLFALPAFSQQRWEKTYGGAGWEEGNSVQQTSDGGYIVAGFTQPAGVFDVFLIKTDSSGETLWTKAYSRSGEDQGLSVRQCFDGGYIIAGWCTDFRRCAYLIKTDTSGDTIWTRTYYGGNFRSVRQTLDSGFVAVGLTETLDESLQVCLIKTDHLGDTLWTKAYGGIRQDFGTSVRQTQDGGYIIAGCTNSFGQGTYKFYLIKTNASGDTLWSRTFGGGRNYYAYSVQQTSDGGYIIAGFADDVGGKHDVFLIKTSSTGITLWQKAFGGLGYDEGYSVCQTSDGGYIIAGYTDSFGAGWWDVYLIKTNALGDTLWSRTYGGWDLDLGNSVQQTSDGGYIIAGWTWSFGAGNRDVYLIKTDANGNVGVETPVRPLDGSTVRPLKATPNPFTFFATLPGHEAERFSLYDIFGRKVGVYKGDRIGAGLSAGVYFLKPVSGDAKPFRIVKLR